MRLLHVTATHLKPDGGVPVVLKQLVFEQNKVDDVEARVVSLVAPVDEMQSPYFEHVPVSEFEHFIDIFVLRYYIEPHGSFGRAAMKKSCVKKWIANRTIFKLQLANAYGFIFLNASEKNDSIYHTGNDIIIPNGIDPRFVKFDFINEKKPTLYFLGRYDIHHKGLDVLCEALKILDSRNLPITINFWGTGNKEAQGFLNEVSGSLKTVKLIINPAIHGEKKDLEIEQLGPMILTSRYEGFPMTILEAWRYGNPCIVTPGTNMSDEIVANNLGWATQMEPQEIANTITQALKEYSHNRYDYISRCKQHVTQEYSWEIVARKSIEELIKTELVI